MLCQSTTSAERDYWAAADAEARRRKMLAIACNEIMTPAKADFFLACVEFDPAECAGLVETIFDAAGWPDDDLDECYLDAAGLKVWRAYRIYRDVRALSVRAA